MPRKFYTDDQRFEIFTRATTARKEGKSWAEAHKDAKDAGFRGKLPALRVYISNVRRKNKKSVREVDRKVRAEKRKFTPAGELETAIERIVQERVRAALTKAVEILNSTINA